MKYEIRYIFSDTDSDEEINELLVDELAEAIDIIKKMKNDDDTLYIYNIDTGDQIEVSFNKSSYFVKDLMRNGFYQKLCTYDELIHIVKTFSDPNRDPISYGMESFG